MQKGMKLLVSGLLFTLTVVKSFAQADNEIQVYASPTIGPGQTIFELHSNHTFRGSNFLHDPKSAHWTNESLEITHGISPNFEIGFYVFSGFAPGGGYQFQGDHIRPRVTVPEGWKWPVGASFSVEFGFFRPNQNADFQWEGEIRPIVDKTIGNWYFAFNPDFGFVLTGPDKGLSINPQFKTVYTIEHKVGVGIEYYGDLGTVKRIVPGKFQEHLLGPMIDLYLDPKWEVNTGMLFGMTENSNHTILKILIGRRVGR